jgi:hypothetical protein
MRDFILEIISGVMNIISGYYIRDILKLKEGRIYKHRKWDLYYYKYSFSNNENERDPLDFTLFKKDFWVSKHWFEVYSIRSGYIKDTCFSNKFLFDLKLADPIMQILYGGK